MANAPYDLSALLSNAGRPAGMNGLPGMPPGLMGPGGYQQQQPQQPNLAALAGLLQSGKVTLAQFNSLAQGAGLGLQQELQQQQQQQLQQQQLQSQPHLAPQNLLAQFAHLPPIPATAFQAHFNSLGLARNMQQKQAVLNNSLLSGYLGGNGSAGGGILMTPEQREAVTREMAETRQASMQILAQCQTFVAQHGGPERINAEIALIQSRRRPSQQPLTQGGPAQPQPTPQQQAQLMAARNKALLMQQQQQQQMQQQQQLFQQQQLQQMQQQNQGRSAALNGFDASGVMLQQPAALPLPMSMGVGPISITPPKSSAPLHLLQTKLRPDVFMKSLFDVMRRRGQPITGTPFIDGKEVDLYQLYQAVMLNGGSEKTNAQQTWHFIAKQLEWDVDVTAPTMNAPTNPDTTALSKKLAELYQQLLHPFEMVWEKALLKQQSQIREKEREAAAFNNRPVIPRPTSASGRVAPGVGWPQNQGGMNGNVQGVGGVGGVPGPSVASQQLLNVGLNPGTDIRRAPSPLASQQLPASTFQLQQPPQQRPGSATAQNPLIGGVAGVANGSTLRQGTIAPSIEQLGEARAIVEELRRAVEASRVKLKAIAIPEMEKAKLTAKTHELTPLVRKIYEILPLFVAMSNQREPARRLLLLGAMFQDQLKSLPRGEFMLGITDLDKLHDQMLRAWVFVKQTSAAAKPPSADASPSQSTTAASSSSRPLDHRSPSDPFSLMAQKNTGLRVEDLKPPPVKQRRSVTGQSPMNEATSPATLAADVESPPKDAQSRLAKGKMPARDARVLGTEGLELHISRDTSGAPAGDVIDELALSLKRKRELDERIADPDGFIERTLRGMDRTAGGPSLLPPDLSAHLPFSYEPAIPPIIQSYSQKRLSFAGYPNAGDPALLAALAASHPIEVSPSQRPLDFDFFIDSTAAGYDEPDATEAPTPDLVVNAEPSPSSDNELEKPSTFAGLEMEPVDFGPMTGAGADAVIEDYEKWFSGSVEPELPSTFNWQGDLPAGSWHVYE